MKKTIFSLGLLVASLSLSSCGDEELEDYVPVSDAVTFSELSIPERFTHVIPDNGFSASGMNFNTVKGADGQLEGGFCYSNRSYRQFSATNTVAAIDSMRYSIWSTKPNATGVYLVCHVKDDKAFFTLDKARTIEYVLVGNTTWDYLAMSYGDQYGTPDKPVTNLNVPSNSLSTSKVYGVWYTNVPGGVKKFTAGDYFTLTAVGYLGGNQVGSVSIDLACMTGHSAEHPTWNYVATNWRRFDLASLGNVDKVVFHLASSDVDADGNMRTPAWFCMDGVKLN